ncbi:uncharacterized protein LOC134273375 [Saccostrea cucullata]|uniref:uncharacterized protein LOC134273375 n=1 Tax=Saccostrea cuccullata TaxID=36930 RepID=UPI002ED28742
MLKILQEKRELLEQIKADILEGLKEEEEIQTEIQDSDECMLDLRLKLRELMKDTLPEQTQFMLSQTFMDCFETSDHSNNSLSDVEKFNYLRSLLCGEALKIISEFALTNSNYRQALDVLSERYGQTHKLTNAYMKKLMDLPGPNSNPNKLPQEFLQEITRQKGDDHWDINTLCKSIKRELSVYEITDFNDYSEPKITSSFITRANAKKMSGIVTQRKGDQMEKKLCIFCNEDHSPINCNIEHNRKLEKIKKDKLCFNCLGRHKVADCKSKKTCKKCNRHHHTSICTRQENAVEVYEQQQKAKVSITPSSVLSLHSTSFRSFQVLFKTAVAEVQSANGTECQANIMFDEGSQRSFINQKLASQLQLEVIGKEVINAAGFGSKKTELCHLDRVQLSIIGERNQHIPTDVFVVPQIGVPI